MTAVVYRRFGPPEVLALEEVPTPAPRPKPKTGADSMRAGKPYGSAETIGCSTAAVG